MMFTKDYKGAAKKRRDLWFKEALRNIALAKVALKECKPFLACADINIAVLELKKVKASILRDKKGEA